VEVDKETILKKPCTVAKSKLQIKPKSELIHQTVNNAARLTAVNSCVIDNGTLISRGLVLGNHVASTGHNGHGNVWKIYR